MNTRRLICAGRPWCLPAVAAVTVLVAVAMTTAMMQPDAGGLKRPAATEEGVSVYFSPDGETMATVSALIDSARQSVSVQTYYFTHDPLAEALIRARKRGVAVDVLWDEDGAALKGTPRKELEKAGVPITVFYNDDALMHNKVVLIDSKVLITGSMNFTWSGDNKNIENTLIIHNRPKIIAAYEKRHEQLIQVSRKDK